MVNQIEEETGALPANLPRGVPPEVAAANPDVQAIIAPRLTMLMEIANSFLLTIIDSMDNVPYGIRWICKQIRSLTRVGRQFSVTFTLILICRSFRESTRRRLIMLSAHSLAVSSSCALSTLLLSHLKRTCSSKASLLNTLGGR